MTQRIQAQTDIRLSGSAAPWGIGFPAALTSGSGERYRRPDRQPGTT